MSTTETEKKCDLSKDWQFLNHEVNYDLLHPM